VLPADFPHFIATYGYFILIPLMIIEGPIVTIVAAFLAATGLFAWPVVWILSVLGDLVSDNGFYFLGKRFGMRFIKGPGRFLGMREDSVLKIEEYFKRHGGKTIFFVKSTTGLVQITFITAGIIHMNYKQFMKNAFLGGLVWSSILVFIGYFYGYLWVQAGAYIENIGIFIFVSAVLTIIGVNIFKRRESKRMLKEN
jgi:membrane protein DedA with SNARE-associated domain